MFVKYATMIVNDMDESVKFYTETLDFTVDEVFNLPTGKITLLNGDGDAGLELIENTDFKTGIYSIGMDVEDIEKEISELKQKGAEIAMDITPISVGLMARIIDPNGINIVLIEHKN